MLGDNLLQTAAIHPYIPHSCLITEAAALSRCCHVAVVCYDIADNNGDDGDNTDSINLNDIFDSINDVIDTALNIAGE